MTMRCLQPDTLPTPGGHYSPVVMAGGQVWVAGQLPVDAQGRPLAHEPFEVQARQVLANIEAALHAAGTTPQRLLQVRVYLVHIDHWGAFNALYADWLGAHRPARTVVPVPSLHHGLLIEAEAVALAGEPAP